MNFYCRKNSASILCYILNKRDNCIALANQARDACALKLESILSFSFVVSLGIALNIASVASIWSLSSKRLLFQFMSGFFDDVRIGDIFTDASEMLAGILTSQ